VDAAALPTAPGTTVPVAVPAVVVPGMLDAVVAVALGVLTLGVPVSVSVSESAAGRPKA
jgi:hypothetical protein